MTGVYVTSLGAPCAHILDQLLAGGVPVTVEVIGWEVQCGDLDMEDRFVPDEPSEVFDGVVTLHRADVAALRAGTAQVRFATLSATGAFVRVWPAQPIAAEIATVDDEHPVVAQLVAVATARAEAAEADGAAIKRAMVQLERLIAKHSLPEIMTRTQALEALGGRKHPESWAVMLVDSIQIPTGGKTKKVLREDLLAGLSSLRDNAADEPAEAPAGTIPTEPATTTPKPRNNPATADPWDAYPEA